MTLCYSFCFDKGCGCNYLFMLYRYVNWIWSLTSTRYVYSACFRINIFVSLKLFFNDKLSCLRVSIQCFRRECFDCIFILLLYESKPNFGLNPCFLLLNMEGLLYTGWTFDCWWTPRVEQENGCTVDSSTGIVIHRSVLSVVKYFHSC